MSKLPYGGFRWLETDEIDKLDIKTINSDGEICYILEVDLEYPKHLHDIHSDYPLAVEKKIITEDQIIPVNQEFLKINKEKFRPSTKLVPDLHNKIKYVCSLRNLQLYLNKGRVLKKIHRVLVANQKNYMSSYIEFNSLKRQAAKTDFEKDFFKLLNNSVSGKFIESVRKRTNLEVVRDIKRANKLTSKPQFIGFNILDKDVTLVQTTKRKIKLDKPLSSGFMVLENAKYIMYDFWYNTLKPKYGSKIKLLLSDTDSFIYGVYTEDAYKDLHDMRSLMDLSGYEKDTVLGKFSDKSNKKVPGKFSDEKPLEIIREVVANKLTMHSIITKKSFVRKKTKVLDIQQRQKECQGFQNRKLLIKTARMFCLLLGLPWCQHSQ